MHEYVQYVFDKTHVYVQHVYDMMHVYVRYVYNKVHVYELTAEDKLENIHAIEVHEKLRFKDVIIYVVLASLEGEQSHEALLSN